LSSPPRPPALVLGGGLTVLGVIRRLAAAGIPALVVGDEPGFERRSRWYRAAPASRGPRPAEDLAAYLRGLEIASAVLLPCSDAWVLRVASLPADLRSRFPASLATSEVLERLLDKWGLAGLLVQARVPHPQTLALDSVDDLARVPDELLRASFLKPRDSLRFFARYGVKAFWVRTREEAAARFAETGAAGLAVQLQEYVPGPADNHYFVDGFVDRAGAVPARFARRRLRMYPPDFGNSTLMVSVPLTEAAGAVDGVTRLLAHVGYRGIFSAEFKRDVRDGEFKLLEVNVRPWWYVEFAGRCGVDVCLLAYHDALGEPIAPVRGYAVGRSCVYPYYDYYACRALRREGRLSLLAWGASWLKAMQPVFRWSDPRPALGEVARLFWSRASRLARRERTA
jgi:predicted ATP-grasp superfamily ATP-dependent carboligase